MVAPNRQQDPSTPRGGNFITYRMMEDGNLAFDFEAPCGNVYKNVCCVLEPLSENPGLQFAGTFGMRGTMRIIQIIKDYRDENYGA